MDGQTDRPEDIMLFAANHKQSHKNFTTQC